ncbi:aldo/keto reductase [Paenibacillus sp. YPG26]|uniref:aldo/keto reductase n=1 Tax=Paenibacillus sp. YPG26 TaxID=2878915 RepID=UPI00203AF94D|nr:aldo/keto reductase [Paenibacillus sp. YPG26]USB32192.1 aldo/keto reductase [Paenibacillus sp. YPG26]
MKKNRLGHSDLYVSEIGFGCMSIGTEETTAIRLIHEAMDQGINFLDTADLYDEGRNEELVGKAIQGRREQVILATKVGNKRIPGQEGWVWDPSGSHIKSAVKESLRRLGTDYIDLYQLHGGTLDDPIDETIEAFEDLRREGLIREYGISSIRPNVILAYVNRSNIVSVMSQYSILDRRPEEQILPLLAKHGISLIARGPLAKGILTESGKEKADKGYLDYTPEQLAWLREDLRKISDNRGALHQTALRYPLYHPVVAAIIPGASSVQQIVKNVQAGKGTELSSSQYEQIQQVTKPADYDQQHRLNRLD